MGNGASLIQSNHSKSNNNGIGEAIQMKNNVDVDDDCSQPQSSTFNSSPMLLLNARMSSTPPPTICLSSTVYQLQLNVDRIFCWFLALSVLHSSTGAGVSVEPLRRMVRI
jgi:hypothetical protein